MDRRNLVRLIDNGILAADKYAEQFCNGDKGCVVNTQKVLVLLKNDVIKFNEIRIDVLRAMHDVGMSSYKEFENSGLEFAINEITALLYAEVPSYKELRPLGAQFEQWVEDSVI